MLRQTSSPIFAVRRLVFLGLLFCGLCSLHAGTPTFSQFIVFGDSLSDTGNDANVSKGDYDVTFPGEDFNYTTGCFTNGSDTNPPSKVYRGVWHEQLARLFFGLPAATNSLNGGMDYAYGGAGLNANAPGTPPGVPTITQQVNGYLAAHRTVSSTGLFTVFGGANDIFYNAAAVGAANAAAL